MSFLFAVAAAAQCEPGWFEQFGDSDLATAPTALCVFNDGHGPRLFAARDSSTGVIAWQPGGWRPVQSPNPPDRVLTLTLFDDGTGPALYAGGRSIVSSSTGGHVARWNGADWQAVGTWQNTSSVTVLNLHVLDDGSGPSLYASGHETADQGRVWRLHQGSWTPIGPSLFEPVKSAAWYGEGPERKLYAAQSGSNAVLVRLDGAQWQAVLLPAPDFYPTELTALLEHDDGTGTKLIVAGSFGQSASSFSRNLGAWDGTSWSTVGGGTSHRVAGLWKPDGDSRLYVYGSFTSAGTTLARGVALWDGAAWTGYPSILAGGATALALFDDGAGPSLIVGALATTGGQSEARGVARWDGDSWERLGTGFRFGNVTALAATQTPSGPRLVAGGSFEVAGDTPATNIAQWDGVDWSALGSGLNGPSRTILQIQDGPLAGVYAGGQFTTAGGTAASNIARWDGTAWSPLGTGVNGSVESLRVFDEGSGPRLFAAGTFTSAGAQPASRIARWDGSAWSPVAGGLNSGAFALAVHDDGSGPALFVGGNFSTAGGLPAASVARWDGSAWSAVGDGFNSTVFALTEFDDGAGPRLYAGGMFTASGIRPAWRVARLQAGAWQALSFPNDLTVRAFAEFDDGFGRALFATGLASFREALWRWDGNSWTNPQQNAPALSSSPSAMAVFEDASGRGLYLGGNFDELRGPASNQWRTTSGLARWGPRPAPACPADMNRDGFIDGIDSDLFLNAFESGDCIADRNSDGYIDGIDYDTFMLAFELGCP